MRVVLAIIFRFLFISNFFKRNHFGIYKRIFRPLDLFKKVKRIVNYEGIILELRLDDWIQENIYFIRNYEKAELTIFKNVLKKEDLFIDIGANFGLYSLIASKIVSDEGSVICFEPFSTNYNVLKKNVALNNISNIKLENKAVGEVNTKTNIYYNDVEKNLGMATLIYNENSRKEEVEIISLDSYVELNSINRINVIKIDVEGFEYNVLKGMENTLRKYKPTLFIEILEDENKLIDNYLFELGYQKHFINDNGGLSEINQNQKRLNYVFKHCNN